MYTRFKNTIDITYGYVVMGVEVFVLSRGISLTQPAQV